MLAGGVIDRDEARAILESSDVELLDLLAAAWRVRHHHFGNTVQLFFLMNAKSGLCPEDCGYCSQSKVSDAEIPRYNLLSTPKLLEAAKLAHLPALRRQGGWAPRLHPALIHGAACSALLRLQAPATVARSAKAFFRTLASSGSPAGERATRIMGDSAIDAIVVLRDVLRDQQLLPPFHGLVSCVPHDNVTLQKPLPWLSCGADDHIVPLAWGLVAIACASPPILLFNRQPSLMWFRESHSMMVRWFGTAAATGASQ